jgi:hypothetical protein
MTGRLRCAFSRQANIKTDFNVKIILDEVYIGSLAYSPVRRNVIEHKKRKFQMKTLCSMLAAGCLLASTGFAFAEVALPSVAANYHMPIGEYMHVYATGVDAGGRCHGIAYGTGARSCGTATGGPVGGLTNRN